VAVSLQQLTQIPGDEVDIFVQLKEPETSGCGIEGVTTTHIYYVEVQLQKRNGGTLEQAFPAKLLGVQTEAYNQINSEYLFSMRIPGTPTRDVVVDEGYDPTNVGTSHEMSEMPNLTPGVPIQK
jgi:hypothetical protein